MFCKSCPTGFLGRQAYEVVVDQIEDRPAAVLPATLRRTPPGFKGWGGGWYPGTSLKLPLLRYLDGRPGWLAHCLMPTASESGACEAVAVINLPLAPMIIVERVRLMERTCVCAHCPEYLVLVRRIVVHLTSKLTLTATSSSIILTLTPNHHASLTSSLKIDLDSTIIILRIVHACSCLLAQTSCLSNLFEPATAHPLIGYAPSHPKIHRSTAPWSSSQPSDSPSVSPTQLTAGKSPSSPKSPFRSSDFCTIQPRPRLSSISPSAAWATSCLACRFWLQPPVPPINQHLRHSPSINPSTRADFVHIATAAILPPASPQNSTSTFLFSPLPVRNKSWVTRDHPGARDT